MSDRNPQRKSTLSRALLECLEAASPYALPEDSLRTECNARIRPPADRDEFRAALDAMRAKRAVAIVPDDFDADLVKWTITEAGKGLLAQLG